MSVKFADATDVSKYREEDLPFLEACWDMLNSSLEDQSAIRMHKGIFNPILDADMATTEVMIDWDVNGSKLKVLMGRTITLVHTTAVHDDTKFHLFKPEKLREAMQRFHWLAPEIIQQYCHVIDKFIEWGYTAHVSTGGNYPVPLVVFGKQDVLVGAVGMIEFTPANRAKPTLN